MSRAVLLIVSFLAVPFVQEASAQQSLSTSSCERLAKLSLNGATVTAAEAVAGGAFTPPSTGRGAGQPIPNLPPFCRVTASARRQGETDVAIEVWLPSRGWNGELRPASSGFAGGAIAYAEMADLLRAGWATSNTNRGHDEAGPWKLSDMTSVSVHLMVQQAKTIVSAYYGSGPKLTLMNACGGGGSRDALQLVQDWPQDLDAAAAVGFVYDPTHHGIGQMWVYAATHKDAASYIPPSKYPIIHTAALDACDAKDGLKDGVIEDPPRCAYDPSVLLCKAGDAAHCLTAPQVEAVRTIYNPAVHAKTGRYLFAGMNPGGELAWEPMAGPVEPPIFPLMWARDAGSSFLRRPPEMLALIEAAGFTVSAWEDVTAETAGSGGPVPAHSIQRLVMGEALDEIIRAGHRNRAEGRIVMVQAVFNRLEAGRC